MVVCLVFFDSVFRTAWAENPQSTPERGGEAVVVLVEGMVSLLDDTGKPDRTLSPGHRCRPGDRIRTGNKSRLSLAFQDGTVGRFSELTSFMLMAPERPEKRNIRFQLLSGEAWVNAARPYTGKGAVSLFASEAVMTTTQGILRLTAFSDHSAIVKVYQGRIEVQRFHPPATEPADDTSKGAEARKTGWNHLLKAMQQLYIRSDGSATKPFRFTLKADESKWVQWNQEQDAKIGTSAE